MPEVHDGRTRRVRSLAGLWLLASLLLIGALAAALSISAERSAAKDRDERAADLAETTLAAQLQATAASLRGADGLVVDGEITEAEFAALADDLVAGSLFGSLGYVEVVAEEDLDAFVARTGLVVRDIDSAGGFTPVAERAEHLVVRYVHPVDDTPVQLPGVDIASDPQRSAAAATAASREPVHASAVLTRIDALAGSTTPGLFGIQAVHGADGTVVGFVSGAVDVADLLRAAAEDADPDVDVSVYLDGELVGGSGAGRSSRTFEVAGVEFTVRADDREGADVVLPTLIVTGTLLLAVGLTSAALRERRLRHESLASAARDRALADLGQRLTAAVDLDEILDQALVAAEPILGVDAVTIGRRNELDPDLIVVRRRVDGAPVEVHRVVALDVDVPLTRSITQTRTQLLELTAGDSVLGNELGAVDERVAPGRRTLRVQPLRFHTGYCVGAVGLEWVDASAAELRALEASTTTFTELVSRAIERAVVTQSVQQGATRLGGLGRALASAVTSTEVAAVVADMVPLILGSSFASLSRPVATTPGPVRDLGTGELSHALGPDVEILEQTVLDGTGAPIATLRVGWMSRFGQTPTIRAVLGTIAELVGLTLARTDRYDQEHELVTEMQTALLPPPGEVPGLEIVVRYQPASQAVGIGGDWYDVVSLRGGRVFAVIGDVSGHGAAAVTTMAQLKAVIAHLLAIGASPEAALAQADVMLAQQGSQATAQLALVDAGSGTVQMSSAGHPYALLRRHRDGTVITLREGQWPMLGVRWRDTSPRVQARSVPFERGDVLLMYTDGLVERRRTSIDQQIARLGELLADIDLSLGLEHAVDELIVQARRPARSDEPNDDDRAVIAVRQLHV